MNETKKSFFEYMGIAHIEKVHSQFIAWIFSKDCMAICTTERQRLFTNLFGVHAEKIEEIYTERNGIDILIETTTEIVVIENKIKSSHHSNQLEKYKQFCAVEFPNLTKHFFYLTLVDEPIPSSVWKPISYTSVYTEFSKIRLIPNEVHSTIIKEYLVLLGRIDSVIKHFNEHVDMYDNVFLDGSKKKHEKRRCDYKTENEWFIASNQLETILQRSFLNMMIRRLQLNGVVSETRGDALVDFPMEHNIVFEGRKYCTGIQLQKKTIKFTFAIEGESYLKSKKEWIGKIIPLMVKLSKDNEYNYTKVNEPKNLAYVSISKEIEGFYWHKSLKQLYNYIQKEIENGKELTKSLIHLIRNDIK